MAYELRRRGYNTEAIDTNHGEEDRIIMRAFSETDTDLKYYVEKAECKSLLVKYGAGVGNVSDDEANKIFADDAKRYDMAKNLKKGMEKNYPNGARGFFTIGWYRGGKHSVVWEIKDGELLIRENQNNVTYKGTEAIEYMSRAGGVFSYGKNGKDSQFVLSCVPYRTDNKTINPEYILSNPESIFGVNKNRTMVNKN